CPLRFFRPHCRANPLPLAHRPRTTPPETTTPAMTIPKNLTLGVIFAIVTGALWGLVFVAPKPVTAFSPLMLVAGRSLVYGLLALGLVLFRLRQILPLLTAKNLAIAFGLAIIGNTLYYLLLTNAILLAGVPIATLIIGLMPV